MRGTIAPLAGIMAIIVCVSLFIMGANSCKKYISENGWQTQYDATRQSNIYSLHLQDKTSGSFVLGIGRYGSTDYYVFYRATDDGGYIREQIEAKECVLYEGYAKPYIIEYGSRAYHLDNGDTIATTFTRDYWSRHYHRIYVPTGTITEKVNDIDLKN